MPHLSTWSEACPAAGTASWNRRLTWNAFHGEAPNARRLISWNWPWQWECSGMSCHLFSKVSSPNPLRPICFD